MRRVGKSTVLEEHHGVDAEDNVLMNVRAKEKILRARRSAPSRSYRRGIFAWTTEVQHRSTQRFLELFPHACRGGTILVPVRRAKTGEPGSQRAEKLVTKRPHRSIQDTSSQLGILDYEN